MAGVFGVLDDHQKDKLNFGLFTMRSGTPRSGPAAVPSPEFTKTTNSMSPGIRAIIEASPLPLPSSLSPPLE